VTIVTFAPGTGAPDWSLTTPEMIPVACPCSFRPEATQRKQRNANCDNFLMFITEIENGC
jgi:hypothetical protein